MARLPLKHVHQFRDRHGKLRHYFRRGGAKAIPLPGLVGSEEFMSAYQAALLKHVSVSAEIGADRTLPGTIDALVVAYYKTTEWANLKPTTWKTRKPFIERFRVANGKRQVKTLRREDVERMMAAIPNLHARRGWLKAIRPLLQSAVPSLIAVNPAEGVKQPKLPKTKGHHSWTDEEIQQYRNYWNLGTQQRLVFEFALEAVSRRCEVVRLGPQHVKDGRIKIERAKGSRDVDIKLTPELKAAIDAMPKVQMVYAVTSYGKPWSIDGLGNEFAKWATEAGLPKKCRMHGLKKGGVRRIVEAGGGAPEVMSVTGHRSLAQVQVYIEDFNRKKLADSAIEKRIKNTELANLSTPDLQTKTRKGGK
jgi:integrase